MKFIKVVIKSNEFIWVLSIILIFGIFYYWSYHSARKQYTETAMLAENGDPESQFLYANNYYYGRKAKKNYQEALRWYQSAAEQGHCKAQYQLGYMYDRAVGIDENEKNAIKWLSKSANQGHSFAAYELYIGYLYGRHSIKRDYNEAFFWGLTRNSDNLSEIVHFLTVSERDETIIRAREWYYNLTSHTKNMDPESLMSIYLAIQTGRYLDKVYSEMIYVQLLDTFYSGDNDMGILNEYSSQDIQIAIFDILDQKNISQLGYYLTTKEKADMLDKVRVR